MPTVEEQALVASEEMLLTEEQELLDSLVEQVEEHDEYLRSIGMGEEEADPSDAHVDIHIDGAAFVDSLGYHAQGHGRHLPGHRHHHGRHHDPQQGDGQGKEEKEA